MKGKGEKSRETYGKFAGIVGIILNVILSLSKAGIALIFGSVSVLADAANNFSDAGSSIVTLVGFKLSGKKPDRKHPYGHARIEYITALIISFIITMLGIKLTTEAIGAIISPKETTVNSVTFIVLSLSVIVKLFLFFFYRTIGRKIDSKALKASSIDSRNDVFVTISVMIGAVLTKIMSDRADGVIALCVALFILYSGIKLIIETSSPLLGTSPDPKLVKAIKRKLLSYEEILGVHDLTVHTYGEGICFATVHVEVDENSDIVEIHELIDNIENIFKVEMNIHLVIHMDPATKDDEKTLNLKNIVTDILYKIDPAISFHDLRIVQGKTESKAIFDICVPISFDMEEDELISIVTDNIRDADSSIIPVISVDHDYTPM